MALIKTDIYVHEFVKIEESTLNAGGSSPLATIKLTTPDNSEVNLGIEINSAKKLRHAILLAMRRHYVATVAKMAADWAKSRSWVSRIIVWGYNESCVVAIIIDPLPETWTTTMQLERIHACVSVGMTIGACLDTPVESHHHEGNPDYKELEQDPDEFWTVAYTRGAVSCPEVEPA